MLLSPEMEAPKLIEVLQEMKNSLDSVNEQIRILTKQVKDNQLLTADGISYLETKHLLMLSYCQSIVYYVLCKAKGLSIQNHPLVRSFVEIKLFIEKIRPIDKKFDYQVQKLLKLADNAKNNNNMDEHTKETKEVNNNDEDPSKFRPNPDMLVPKVNVDGQADGLYRAPRIAPITMDSKLSRERVLNKEERGYLRNSKSSSYLKDFINEIEDKPEELDNSMAPDSIEVSRYVSKQREQASQEEEFFFRAPVTKKQKKHEKQIMRNARNGMAALTDGFGDVLKMLPQTSKDNTDSLTTMMTTANKGKGFKRRKTKHKH